MTTTTIEPITEPIETPVQAAPSDDGTCYVCGDNPITECNYCDKWICDAHVHLKIALMGLSYLAACPLCWAKMQRGAL